jgi:hypothetical protein
MYEKSALLKFASVPLKGAKNLMTIDDLQSYRGVHQMIERGEKGKRKVAKRQGCELLTVRAVYMLCTTFVSSVTRKGRCGTCSPEMELVCEQTAVVEGRCEEAKRRADVG